MKSTNKDICRLVERERVSERETEISILSDNLASYNSEENDTGRRDK